MSTASFCSSSPTAAAFVGVPGRSLERFEVALGVKGSSRFSIFDCARFYKANDVGCRSPWPLEMPSVPPNLQLEVETIFQAAVSASRLCKMLRKESNADLGLMTKSDQSPVTRMALRGTADHLLT